MSEAKLDIDRYLTDGPQSVLERRLIEEYLAEKGYRIADLQAMAPDKAKELMKEASQYASLKLSEVESRAKFRGKIDAPGT